ncbi:MAG: hypothetical protein IKW83_09095 [Muribaculaceae bacterium]|nr:hypothetical protein [Muribaculaceae bacterium]
MENDTEIRESYIVPEKKKRRKLPIFLGVLVALLALALAASWVRIHHITNHKNAADMGLKNATGQISEKQSQLTDLKMQLDTTTQALKKERTAKEMLIKENDSLRTLFPIYIMKLEVANADGNGNAISQFGKDISAASSMYLLPQITYCGFKLGEKVDLQVKLYNPDGDIVLGTESPKDESYSYTFTINSVQSSNKVLLNLKGWGGPDKGHFPPGVYRYEVWYNDMCLKAVTFKLK